MSPPGSTKSKRSILISLLPCTAAVSGPYPSNSTRHTPASGASILMITPVPSVVMPTPASLAETCSPDGLNTLTVCSPATLFSTMVEETMRRDVCESTGASMDCRPLVPKSTFRRAIVTISPLSCGCIKVNSCGISDGSNRKSCPPVSSAPRMYAGSTGEQLPVRP